MVLDSIIITEEVKPKEKSVLTSTGATVLLVENVNLITGVHSVMSSVTEHSVAERQIGAKVKVVLDGVIIVGTTTRRTGRINMSKKLITTLAVTKRINTAHLATVLYVFVII